MESLHKEKSTTVLSAPRYSEKRIRLRYVLNGKTCG